MPDTPRTISYLTGTEFADGQAPKSITPQYVRDLVVSVPRLFELYSSTSYLNDAAAASGGVPLGQTYRGNGNFVRLRSDDTHNWNPIPQPQDYGAKGDGTTDDAAAFAAAITANPSGMIYVPPGTYRLASGITLTGTTVLHGEHTAPGDGTAGTVLLFDNGVATCVTLNGGGGNNAPGLRSLTIKRAGGAPPVGSIGILVTSCYNNVLQDVMSYNHAKCYRWLANGTTGLSTMATRIFSAAATDVHIEIDSWPEIRFSQCRFGKNGTGDVNCNAYVRITGGEANPATHPGIGPNGIIFDNCQFNQGVNTATRWVTFDSMLGGGFTAGIFAFNNCHVEAVSNGIGSNASTSLIYQVSISNLQFNTPVEFFALDAATATARFGIVNSVFANNVTLNCQMDGFRMVGCYVGGALSVTGSGTSTADIVSVNTASGTTLAGAFTSGSVLGGTGGVSLTASGPINIVIPALVITNSLTYLGNGSVDVVVGTRGAKPTSSTAGNLHIPFVAGTPTGVPGNAAGGIALLYDTTAHKLWAYDNGTNAWRGIVLT